MLREENLAKFHQLSCLRFVSPNTLNKFWKQAVLNFDKDFTKLKIHNTSIFQDTIINVWLVERESDKRLGVLVYLKETLDRFVIHKDGRRVHVTSVQCISNRSATVY